MMWRQAAKAASRCAAVTPTQTAMSPITRSPVRCTQRASRMSNRSEEHTSELQSLMRISYAVFCLKKKHLHSTQYAAYLHTSSRLTQQATHDKNMHETIYS